jgi:tol-pal system protein YbgF
MDAQMMCPNFMNRVMTRAVSAAALALTASLPAATPAAAQQPATPAKAAPAPKAAKAPAKPKAETSDATPAAATDGGKSGDAQLRQRVDQLEEQLVDLQVTIGTLESLARGPGASGAGSAISRPASGGGSGGGADNGRVDLLETQIRALTAQVEQLSDQVRSPRRSPAAAETQVAEAPRPVPPPSGQSGFGSGTVSPGPASPPAEQTPPPAQASTPPGQSDPGAKQLYESAYGHLLQTNYAAAETAFDEFVTRYPNDALSGNAQYWLGESFFVRAQYKQAASAFLKGYQTYGKSSKAPDSLLKLALSLDRLGQKDASCSAFGEFSSRFPGASAPLKAKADNERRRIGC